MVLCIKKFLDSWKTIHYRKYLFKVIDRFSHIFSWYPSNFVTEYTISRGSQLNESHVVLVLNLFFAFGGNSHKSLGNACWEAWRISWSTVKMLTKGQPWTKGDTVQEDSRRQRLWTCTMHMHHSGLRGHVSITCFGECFMVTLAVYQLTL